MLKIKELGSKLGLNPADWAEQDIAETELGWVPGHPIPADPLRWGKSFKEGSEETLRNTQMRRNLGYATGKIRAKRNTRVEEMPDWEALRESASNIKRTVAANWVDLLEQFEANVTAKGGVVHWARDADEANRIVYDLVKAKGVDEVVKVKSMATQEINLNEYLGKHGIQAWETDLAEMIVQLSDDMPSHVVVPAIHRNRAEVKAIFEARMEDAGELTHEPRVLAMAARAHLRKKFLSAKVAISGANIGVAETGTVGIYESEGNGRMCLTLPETLITVMGIEKLVPRFQDLEVFSQLLPRSATGERMNPYTSFWTGVTEGDGPQEFHIILMDNGRTNVLKDPVGREALKCIRCAACMNICPVYRVTGGHAYNSVYPGPIGAILTPQLLGATDHKDPAATLPFASSLCGACYDVCPVKINIPDILVHLRHKYTEANRGGIPDRWDIAMKATSKIMSSGKGMEAAGKAVSSGRLMAGKDRKLGYLPLPVVKDWTRTRDVPAPPAQSFRQWWQEEGCCGSGSTSQDCCGENEGGAR
ncbi:MAG: LutB/LldF family L-lactate oxidation iron-sulfur protein [Trueperella sp.]|uniref:LutB/LldF family L-lactate oxidation iron-sulfur protein n=1 Tax=Trueperella sp. TaxID=2699835 RepID=UPI002A910804|nr:LutB/LldF family L-lactate oxidation iron-sulfur protein [Trueperella sp.]MDY5403270.1 LutB/LldF family L-lactate oxidation iron-sulfur protein [Trueperella sp.]